MAKKRQQDFNKTQMKVGRTVAKRRNVTDTSFKAKKIIVPNKASAPKDASQAIQEALKTVKSNASNTTKINALETMGRLVRNNKHCLPALLSDILETVLRYNTEADENLRRAATNVIIDVFNNTESPQLKSFVPFITNSLSCSMTNPNMRVREHSLKLLIPMIERHASLICGSKVILNQLYQMLIGTPRTRMHSQSAVQQRRHQKLPVLYSQEIYSPHWRVTLIGCINQFVKNMLRSKSAAKRQQGRDDVEQEVYWDSESPLNLEIYAGGGLRPVDIERYCGGSEKFYDDSENVTILESIVEILPTMYTEEIASASKGDDHLYESGIIHNLNIIFTLLSSITDWLEYVPSEELEKLIRKFLKEYIYDKKRFPFRQFGNAPEKNEEQAIECMMLNLNVCYLFSTYLLNHIKNEEELCEDIFQYVKTVLNFQRINMRYQSIPLIVKVLNIYFEMGNLPEISDHLRNSLQKLCTFLKHFDHQEYGILLTSFFTKLSLDSAYSFVAESDVMKPWYNWLLNRLISMPTADGVDRKLTDVIKKIAARRYPCFQDILMAIDFRPIKTLLKFEDDNVRDAAIFLIYHMKEISSDLLDKLACLILTEDSFPTKFAVRLIRLLTYRFSEKPYKGHIPVSSIHNGKGAIDIIQFLLNIAVDSYNLDNPKFLDCEANDYTKCLKMLENFNSYRIVPSLHWKKHSVLFDVCVRFLNQLSLKYVANLAMMMFKEILDTCRFLPMHSAIAILKLTNQEMGHKYYRVQINDLTLTVFLTVSILTQEQQLLQEEWCLHNVEELLQSVQLNSHGALETFSQLDVLKDDALDGMSAYHVLRVIKYYLDKQLLNPEDSANLLRILANLKEKCSDKTLHRQPLFIKLYENFSYYM